MSVLNAKYFVGKNYTLGKWGTRKAFNQNSLMQHFNGDRRIVQWWNLEHALCYRKGLGTRTIATMTTYMQVPLKMKYGTQTRPK